MSRKYYVTESWKNLSHKQLHNLMQVSQISKLNFFEVNNDDFPWDYLYTFFLISSLHNTVIWHHLSILKPFEYLPDVPSPSRSLGYKLERDALLIPEFLVSRWLLNWPIDCSSVSFNCREVIIYWNMNTDLFFKKHGKFYAF